MLFPFTISRYVKDKRPTISPNFNFLGQLLEYQKLLLQKQGGGVAAPPQSLLSPEVSSPVSKTSPRADIPPEFPENEPVSAQSRVPPPVPRKPLRAVVPSTQAEQQTPTTPTTESRMLFKRSCITQSQSEPCNLGGKITDRLPSSPLLAVKSKTIPRPSGLDVKKVSHLGPIFLDLQASETKKSRSGRNSPCTDLLDMLNQGTSNLSVNSPEVRHKNPFVAACERLHTESLMKKEEDSSPKVEVEDIRSKVEEEHLQTQTQEQPKSKSDSKLKGKKDIKKEVKPLGIMTRRISREKSPAASPTHRRKQLHTKLRANLAAEAEKKTKQVPSPSDTSVGFQFGRTRIDTTDNVPELPPKSAKSSLIKAKAKDLPKLCVLSKSSSKDESSTLSAGASDTSPFFSRQLSTQSYTSDSSGISPSCESETSSLLERNSSCSSGISPDFPCSQVSIESASGSNFLFEQTTPEPESAQVLPGGINPFQFFSSSTEENTISNRVTYEKLKDPDESSSSCSSRKSSGTPGLSSDRHGGLSSKRCYGSTDTSDSDHSETTRCNRKTSMLISGRSQSCEEISSCAREAVSEIVVSSRREYSLSSLDREDDDYDTRSLSSQRSLSSSCEMIEVS